MAVCKIVSPHLALESGASIIDSTFTGSSAPAAKLLTPHLFDSAQSDGAASQYVTFDFGTAVDVEAVAILGHTIPSSPTVLRVAGNSTDSWSSPASGWIDLTWDADKIIEFFGTPHNYRYWRLEATASAAFQIGSIVLGSVWEAPHEGYDGLSRRLRKSSDGCVIYEVWNFGFNNLTQEESEGLLAILECHLQGNHSGPYHWGSRPTLVCLDSGDEIVADGLESWSRYGVFSGELGATMGLHTRDSYSLTLEECL